MVLFGCVDGHTVAENHESRRFSKGSGGHYTCSALGRGVHGDLAIFDLASTMNVLS